MARKNWAERVRSRGNLLTFPLDVSEAALRRLSRAWSCFRLRTLYGASVGQGCHIGSGIKFVYPHQICIHDRVIIGRHARFWCEVPSGQLKIGTDAEIGRASVLDFSGGLTIGAGVLISEEVLVYTHDHGYDPRSTPKCTRLEIGEGCWIGARAIILPGVNYLGRNAIIGAGATVTKDVPDEHVYVSGPGRLMKKCKNEEASREQPYQGTSFAVRSS